MSEVTYENREQPTEYQAGKPINCSGPGCEVVMDEDDDDIKRVDDDAFCAECLPAAQREGLTKAISAAMTTTLDGVQTKLYDLSKEYGAVDENDTSGPYQMIDDVAARIKYAYSEGKDTGWRDGVMMDFEEGSILVVKLESVARSLEITAQVRRGMVKDSDHNESLGRQPNFQRAEWEFEAFDRAAAEIRAQVEVFKAIRNRTRAGLGKFAI